MDAGLHDVANAFVQYVLHEPPECRSDCSQRKFPRALHAAFFVTGTFLASGSCSITMFNRSRALVRGFFRGAPLEFDVQASSYPVCYAISRLNSAVGISDSCNIPERVVAYPVDSG